MNEITLVVGIAAYLGGIASSIIGLGIIALVVSVKKNKTQSNKIL